MVTDACFNQGSYLGMGQHYVDTLPAHLCRSYRHESKAAPQPGCVHVSFHGKPKPHEVQVGWVQQLWSIT